MSKITITRALSEKKILKKRIIEKTKDLHIAETTIGTNIVPGFDSNDLFKKESEDNVKSIESLFERLRKINKAIIDSNSNTIVKINDQEYTISEIIAIKNSFSKEGCTYDKQFFLNSLKKNFQNKIEDYEMQLYTYSQKREAKTLEPNKKTEKGLEEELKVFESSSKPKLISSDLLKGKIKNLEEEVESFLQEIDFVLSENNSKTEIEIKD